MSIWTRSIRPVGERSDIVINCYAFDSVPPFAQGLVRDLRARWSLHEVGLPHRVTLVGDRESAMPRSAYRTIQPFGQIPAIEDGDLTLFESGAIVLYVAERGRGLLPDDPASRLQAAVRSAAGFHEGACRPDGGLRCLRSSR
jgi:glutathione S-transferase